MRRWTRPRFRGAAAATIGTPDDLIERNQSVLEISAGSAPGRFRARLGQPENTMRSWDMVARYCVRKSMDTWPDCGSRRTSSPTTAPCSSVAVKIMAKNQRNEAAVAALGGHSLADADASASMFPTSANPAKLIN